MKVLFLDIDGVCNCVNTKQRHRGFIGIDPEMAALVAKIVAYTECEVVLSSAWRHTQDGIDEVVRCVVPIMDTTRLTGTGRRGEDIQAWLDEHPEVTRYAILDDDSDMLDEQKPNFFKTSWLQGITPEIAREVIAHLNA